MLEAQNKKQNPQGIIIGLMVFIPLVLAAFMPHIAWVYFTGVLIYGYHIYLTRKLILKDIGSFLVFVLFVYLLERLL
ncbi:hypothetical protein GJU40_03230 [Bacillus lacus]|uniref:Uncharacterized protein n=1 Tax=Metabacillus lacus TaxID=1983721 RepID=A0A7X2IX18_9BACI|nr:hypothetical protein [Metabacillus lacus]MRX71184.1 hypothetical protein [Metabacillus lacus]